MNICKWLNWFHADFKANFSIKWGSGGKKFRKVNLGGFSIRAHTASSRRCKPSPTPNCLSDKHQNTPKLHHTSTFPSATGQTRSGGAQRLIKEPSLRWTSYLPTERERNIKISMWLLFTDRSLTLSSSPSLTWFQTDPIPKYPAMNSLPNLFDSNKTQ